MSATDAGPPARFAEVDGRRIAYLRRRGAGPGVVWLPGFKSDMRSGKAEAVAAWAARNGRAMLRFDYSGHGESGGRFEDGTIGAWLDDAVAMIRAETSGPQILVGSSMGGWLALLAARALAGGAPLAGMVLIAPAVDFTQALMWERMPAEARAAIERDGVWLRQSAYALDPYPITRALIEEGRGHLLLGGAIRTHCPVHIIQGMQDEDVPWTHAMMLVEHLAGDPVVISLVKDGDHRLARDEDIQRLLGAVEGLS